MTEDSSDVVEIAADEMAEVFRTWNTGDLDSFLIEITAEVLRQVDAETGAIRRPITLANAYALPYDASALAIAKHLESLDVVRFVAYPGLESHLHHEVAASQLARPDSGFGGVLSFGLDTDHDGHNRFVSKLNVITSAVSLGHDESLIEFLGEDDERQYLYPPEFHRGFFRLAVGLEDTDDLIRDIDHALVEAGFEV